jgi:hypothetical protein
MSGPGSGILGMTMGNHRGRGDQTAFLVPQPSSPSLNKPLRPIGLGVIMVDCVGQGRRAAANSPKYLSDREVICHAFLIPIEVKRHRYAQLGSSQRRPIPESQMEDLRVKTPDYLLRRDLEYAGPG